MSTNNPNINKFFNKLYVSFPNIINIDKSKEFGNMRYVYTTKDSGKWFVKYKNNNQEVFLFGKIKDESPQPPLLTLTFDESSSFSKNCSGIINEKNVYINIEYFINNYPKFKTRLNESTINVFINSHSNSVNVIKLGNYVDNIDILIDNLNTLLNELYEFKPVEETKPNITFENSDKICEICGKKLKNNKFKLCKKCSKKRHAANILVNLLKHVNPQTPFEKADLNMIYHEEIEIDDCIWSLEEFNLLTQNKNEYCLVNSEKLNEFVKKYSAINEIPLKKEEKKEKPKKLNKKCSVCKKTLSTSKFYKSKKTDDGFEDYCKSCKKYVNAANYLEDILKQISPGSEFKVTDLKNNFKNPLEFNGRLWELQNFDLLIYDSDKEKYVLSDLKTCQNFLDNYYIRGSITIKPELKKENDTKKLTEEQQMNSVIECIINGKTDKEAAEITSINLYQITHWFNEGKNNQGKEYVDFYTRYIEAKKEVKLNSYKNFYVIESYNLKEDLTIADTLRKQQMEKILKEIGSGSSLKKAAFNSGITYETLQYWYKRGKRNFGEEYNEFYEKINILQSPIEVPKPYEEIKKEKIDKTVEEIKEDLNIPELYKHILNPLHPKYNKQFKKQSSTGFAWVNKGKSSWKYNNKNLGVNVQNINLYELYLKVKERNLPWGVRDLEKAKESLTESKKPDIQPKTHNNEETTNIKTNEETTNIKTNEETTNIKTNEETTNKTNEIKCLCFEEKNSAKIIINGLIENDKFLNTLYKFKSFEKNIKKIISDRHTQSTELFIELELEKNRLNIFKDRIKMYGWKIIN